MKAVRMHDFGGTEVLFYEDVPRPEPGAGQLLVQVYAAGVGYWDGEIRRGEWRGMFDYPLPVILGTDVSGIVAAVGSGVTDLKVGDGVYGVVDMTLSGSNAEYAVGRAETLAPKPTTLDHVVASAIPIDAATAQIMVLDLAKVTSGQTVLIQGAGGGVGGYAVQFARRAGAHVIATASAADLDYVRDLGAEEVFDYRTTRFEEVVNEVDALIDPVPSSDVRDRSYGVLKLGGILVTSAIDPGQETATQRGVRAAFVVGEVTTARLRELTPLFDEGALKPRISTILPLAEAKRAHEMLENHQHHGKIVLQVVK